MAQGYWTSKQWADATAAGIAPRYCGNKAAMERPESGNIALRDGVCGEKASYREETRQARWRARRSVGLRIGEWT